MFYKDFRGKKLSALGFGAMRLPTMADGSVDEAQVRMMVDYAIKNGVNYFDTAWPYHGGMSERIMGRVLTHYPRESFYLADKFPGHQISATYDPAATFEEQLRRCGVEYFDFYLLHNVYEKSIKTYLDPRWGILEYFREQKKLGRIKHLGFSTHGSIGLIEEFLDICGEDMEFCQIQLNYLDWTLQDAKAKYDMLTRRGIPVWVMEPVRGGKLAALSDENSAKLKALRSDEKDVAWCFRFLQSLPNVTMTLSGMSNMAQIQENIATYAEDKPLNVPELETVFAIAEGMKNSVPCTSCRYCCDGCPAGLEIPRLLAILNDMRFAPVLNTSMLVEAMPEEKRPTACLSCGKCTKICPQGIDVPALMEELTEHLAKLPSLAEVSRQREEEQKRNQD